MGQVNENKEEDERNYAIGGSVGCLVAILIAFGLLVITIIVLFVSVLSNGAPLDGNAQ